MRGCVAARPVAAAGCHRLEMHHASQGLPHCLALLPQPHNVQFGVCQDCYMPKDPSKQGHRGIGFVTYASPESGAQCALERTAWLACLLGLTAWHHKAPAHATPSIGADTVGWHACCWSGVLASFKPRPALSYGTIHGLAHL